MNNINFMVHVKRAMPVRGTCAIALHPADGKPQSGRVESVCPSTLNEGESAIHNSVTDALILIQVDIVYPDMDLFQNVV